MLRIHRGETRSPFYDMRHVGNTGKAFGPLEVLRQVVGFVDLAREHFGLAQLEPHAKIGNQSYCKNHVRSTHMVFDFSAERLGVAKREVVSQHEVTSPGVVSDEEIDSPVCCKLHAGNRRMASQIWAATPWVQHKKEW